MRLSNPLGVSVIMPTFNEAGNIEELIHRTASALSKSGVRQYEIIVVDDDSPDGTWEKASHAIGTGESRIRIIRRMEDHGLTASLRDGIRASAQEVVVWMDCDFSHPPEKIPQMLYMIEQGYDVAVNSRYTIGGGEERSGKGGTVQLILSRLLNWGVRFLLKPSFSDYTSGFIAVRRPVLQEFDLRGDYGEYFIDFIYRVIRCNRYSLCELPYFAPARHSGESKTGTNLQQYARRGVKYFWTVVRLRLATHFSDGLLASPGKRNAVR